MSLTNTPSLGLGEGIINDVYDLICFIYVIHIPASDLRIYRAWREFISSVFSCNTHISSGWFQ